MMNRRTVVLQTLLLAVFAALCAPSWAVAAKPAGKPGPAETGPRPNPVPTPKPEAIDKAIERGVEFLLARQNKDGSWGSARNTKGLNIYAPVPGAHHAFRSAVTSLCISALIEIGPESNEVSEAIDRGEAWLFEHLPEVRRATPDAIYNTWAHAYSLQALARMFHRHADDPKLGKKIKRLAETQLDLLERYECVDGGWCYYDFNAHTKQPSGDSVSFVSATVLVALYAAKEMGVEAPQRLIDRATASIRRQRKPDFSYTYSESLKYRPMYGINRPGGSLGRSQSCNLAMRLWGDCEVTDGVLNTWLDRLFARNLWLDIGRKRPIPHESWMQVAGYFYYHGHYYAALSIDQLEPADRAGHQDQLAHLLLRLQEKDGSWWDYPLYDYHQQYGTAFALMSLARCRREQAG
ncbi:MAG: prenyltransferase/squalene oxidase repeat-containing protein [Planctomycetota bacterium]